MEERAHKERQLEDQLSTVGFGFFHVLLAFIVALADAANMVEIFGVSFILPLDDIELVLRTARKGYMNASIFVGMLIGAYVWGSLADVFGRRRTLLSAMLINGVCGLVAAFSPNYLFFLFFRVFSGIGVGGSMPIVLSYISEFFTEKLRGPAVIALWQPGVICAVLLAWGLLGTGIEISFNIGSLHFVNWRLYLVICTVPAFLSSCSLIFMPETPAYLFQSGRTEQLNEVLNKIHRVNTLSSCFRCCLFKPVVTSKVPLLTQSGDNLDQSPEMDEKAKTFIMKFKSTLLMMHSNLKKVISTTVGLFTKQNARIFLLLLVIWFTLMFGFFGLQLWFPEFFDRLIGDNCNTTAEWTNCSGKYYQSTLFIAISTLPGHVVGLLLITVLGGRIQLVVSMLLSSLSVLLIWAVPSTNGAVLGVSCMFSAVSVMAFGGLNVSVLNLYDTTSRATSFGVFLGVGRIGAILGNITFGYLMDVDRAIPILIVASLLAVGAVAAIFLPQIYRPENLPPLERAIARFKSSKFCQHAVH